MTWKIDRDYIKMEGFPSRVGVMGGRRTESPDRIRWRVLDDDGNVYYGGWSNEGETFGPLDFAMRDAGATEIHYRSPDGEWVRL